MEKGFTLVELIATIVVIGLIAAFALPQVLNQFNNHQEELSKQQEELILESARSYVLENASKFPNAGDGKIYCISLSEMVTAEALEESIAKSLFGDSYATAKHFNASYQGSSIRVSLADGTCH